ncbi:tryptophan halogenase family protein [Sphingomonas sp.]|uniref:tryptophan halogenase family protein n=1 Tax=Sphingomonas sp. TaxID=28214 RepID=UPI0025F32D17|nr:tryptophan halogenase family protein [Sphingomonas sp.]MBV9529036.1 tryptophan 7-halogenase [Sphingomonas sp.]
MAEPQDIRRIVIVGGGTAGWMAAAALSRFVGGAGRRIVLVESEAIGTVGVGEGTIPPILEFNTMLGIDEAQFLRETHATYKLGIDFVGWTRPGDRYFHQFGQIGRPLNGVPFHQLWLRNRENAAIGPLSDYSISAVVADRHRFGHPSANPDDPLSQLAFAFHFDAAAYGRFLRRYAEGHGAERIEGRIVGVEQHSESGFVTAVTLEDDRRVRGDLFIDCSGFRSLLLGQMLGIGFEDWSHWLPCDRAIAVPSERTEPLLPYTRSTAQPAGWQWRIPLQHRTGNGHVYCSSQMTDDEAEHILRGTLDGAPIAEPNRLRFTAGRRSRAWEANVIAIGLSSGFLEPLESTSIHLMQHGIQKLLSLFPDRGISPVERDEYNRHMVASYDPIRDFLILHYIANRRHEPFWRQVRETPLPDTLRHKIELFREHGRVFRYNDELFDVPSWVAVMLGQDIMPAACDPLAAVMPEAEVLRAMAELRRAYEIAADRLPLASEFIARRVAAAA